ncbi:MAG: VOC family protein [Planctomycetota bacterium]|nr:VOC family protein [Planctomycetota bacterium]
MSYDHIPEGYSTLTSYYLVQNVQEYIHFLELAFQAETLECFKRDDGTIMHAEVQIGDSRLMLGGAGDDTGSTKSMQYMYVPDVDLAFAHVMEAGAESLQDPEDQFYGHRTCGLKDPFGNQWWLANKKEAVDSDEISRRAKESTSE